MIDTTWNRLNLMIKRGDLNSTERYRLLLSSGCDGLNLPFGCLTQLREQRLIITHSTQSGWENAEFDLHQTLCQFTLAQGDLITSTDLSEYDWQQHGITPEWHLRTYIGTPVKIQDRVYGTLFFASNDARPQEFSKREQAFLQMMVGSFRALLQQEAIPR
ncbi:MAG: GAF domain-containing protein [Anaerolineae bacterium]